jgi:hypothetical protein
MLTFSPDGTKLIAIRNDEIMLIWDIASRELFAEIELQLGFIAPKALRYSEDAIWLGFFGGQTGLTDTVFLWRAEDINKGTLPAQTYTYYFHVTGNLQTGVTIETRGYEPSAEPLDLTADQYEPDASLRVLHRDTNEVFAQFFMLPWEYSLDAFHQIPRNPNVEGTLSAAKRSSNAIYDAATAEVLTIIGARTEPYVQVEFDPSGDTIATTDGVTATVWGVPTIPENPSDVICDGAPAPRLQINDTGVITGSTGLRELRIRAYPNGTVIASVPSFTTLNIVRGPICANGVLWWGIETLDGSQYGWAAEALSEDDYLIVSQ